VRPPYLAPVIKTLLHARARAYPQYCFHRESIHIKTYFPPRRPQCGFRDTVVFHPPVFIVPPAVAASSAFPPPPRPGGSTAARYLLCCYYARASRLGPGGFVNHSRVEERPRITDSVSFSPASTGPRLTVADPVPFAARSAFFFFAFSFFPRHN
jgi:hypothetical protein